LLGFQWYFILPIAQLFAYFFVYGYWAMYRTFVPLYPKLNIRIGHSFFIYPKIRLSGAPLY
jgi:hypothetical protein